MNISFYFTTIHLTTSISGFPSDEHQRFEGMEGVHAREELLIREGEVPLSLLVSPLTLRKSGVK